MIQSEFLSGLKKLLQYKCLQNYNRFLAYASIYITSNGNLIWVIVERGKPFLTLYKSISGYGYAIKKAQAYEYAKNNPDCSHNLYF